jgi:phospholipid/cholesterol/gamma-HCH transport system substrate-binding protein
MNFKSLRVGVLISTVLVVLAFLIVLTPLDHIFDPKLEAKTYFQNSVGLRDGAPVRLAGVQIGKVKSVRVRPTVKEAPVEVVMVLQTPYEIPIPSDSIVMIGTEGVLGQTYAEIDTRNAFGPSIGDRGILKSLETAPETTQQLLEKLGNILSKRPCDCDTKKSEGAKISAKTEP